MHDNATLKKDILSYMLVFAVILVGFMQAMWALILPDYRSSWQLTALFMHLTHAMMGSTDNLEKFMYVGPPFCINRTLLIWITAAYVVGVITISIPLISSMRSRRTA